MGRCLGSSTGYSDRNGGENEVLVICLEKVLRWSNVRGIDGYKPIGLGSTSKGPLCQLANRDPDYSLAAAESCTYITKAVAKSRGECYATSGGAG